MKKILITGGDGRFASELKKANSKFKLIFCGKKKLDILSPKSIRKSFLKYKPNYILHLAGLSRPMKIHEKNIDRSINLNIIGTANIVNECFKKKIKLIYISTNYLYPGNKGNYKETDALLPWNNYGWSKLGGESSVQMYKDSLIIRCALTEYPFRHKKAFFDVKSNFIYHKDFIPILFKIIDKKGIINVGEKSQTIFNFVKKDKKDIIKTKSKGKMPKRIDMNLRKLVKNLKNENNKNKI
jgi:dTDP-4-dehydrorhamnose reductase